MSEIQELLDAGVRLREMQHDHATKVDAWRQRLRDRVNVLFEEAIPSVPSRQGFFQKESGVVWHLDSKTNSHWDPVLVIDGVAHRGFKHAPVSGRWIAFASSIRGTTIYPHQLQEVDRPFDPAVLDSVCTTIATEFGIDVVLAEYSLVETVDRPRCLNEVLVKHPGATVVAQGKVEHPGWEIGDPWLVIRDVEGVLWAYWATNGHSSDFDFIANTTVVGPGTASEILSFTSFLSWAKEYKIVLPADNMGKNGNTP